MKTLAVFFCGVLVVVMMASTTHARKYCMRNMRDIEMFLQYNCENVLLLSNKSRRSLRKKPSKFDTKRTLCRAMTMQDYVRFHADCCERSDGCSDQEVTSYCCLQ